MRGAPGGYDNDAGLDWFVWSAKDIHYYADLPYCNFCCCVSLPFSL